MVAHQRPSTSASSTTTTSQQLLITTSEFPSTIHTPLPSKFLKHTAMPTHPFAPNNPTLTPRSLSPDLTINLIFGLLSGILALLTIIQAAYFARSIIRRSRHVRDLEMSPVELEAQESNINEVSREGSTRTTSDLSSLEQEGIHSSPGIDR